jgi:Na+/H+-dicarboxylate symporter
MGEQLTRAIPANPFKAVADGDILPLFIFFILFALALTRVGLSRGIPWCGSSKGVGHEMLGWAGLSSSLLSAFSLSSRLSRLGWDSAPLVSWFITSTPLSSVCAVHIPVVPNRQLSRRRFNREFAPAAAPSQAVALSTQSRWYRFPL